MPLRRKLKTTRFSLRSPTLKVKYWPTTAQQSQAWPSVTAELMSEELPLPGRFWKSKKKEAPPNSPRSRSPMKTEGLHCEPCSVPGSLPRRSLNCLKAGRERDGARVVEGLEGFDGAQHGHAAAHAERDGEVAQAAALAEHVDVGAHVREQLAVGARRRAQARLDVERREAARHAAVGEAGEGVDGVELVAAPGDERAAEGRVEEILLPDA